MQQILIYHKAWLVDTPGNDPTVCTGLQYYCTFRASPLLGAINRPYVTITNCQMLTGTNQQQEGGLACQSPSVLHWYIACHTHTPSTFPFAKCL